MRIFRYFVTVSRTCTLFAKFPIFSLLSWLSPQSCHMYGKSQRIKNKLKKMINFNYEIYFVISQLIVFSNYLPVQKIKQNIFCKLENKMKFYGNSIKYLLLIFYLTLLSRYVLLFNAFLSKNFLPLGTIVVEFELNKMYPTIAWLSKWRTLDNPGA